MRLHHLSLRAIGPFADRHEIDFDALGASGLFLLEGPTGAGKSTIIDAVVFALYGTVAGSHASDDRLASDFAAAGVEPAVELLFSTASGVFRVVRSPRHERAKLRGTGRRTVNAQATLMRLAGVDDPVGVSEATGVADVNISIRQQIGLTHQQFVQTVVLPQGEFATFLQSDADKRRDLLERLFGTEVYSRVQALLEQRRRDAKDRLRGADQAVGQSLAVFLAAAPDAVADQGVPHDTDGAHEALRQASADPAQDADLEAALSARLAGLEQQAVAERLRFHTERERADTQRAVMAEATRQHERIMARRAALAEQGVLDATRDDADQQRAQLAATDRFDSVRGVIEGLAAAEVRLTEATLALQSAAASLPADLGRDGWAARREALRSAQAELGEVIELEVELPARAVEVERLGGVANAAAASLAALRDEQLGLPAQAASLDAERAILLAVLSDDAARVRRHREIQERLSAAKELVGLRSSLQSAQQHLQALAEVARLAVDREATLRRRRIEGMAGELATGLVPTEPCPVCGSTEHPQPAAIGNEHVTAEQVDEAQQARVRAEAEVDQARARSEAVASSIAHAEGVAGAAAISVLTEQLAAAAAAVAEVPVARNRLVEVEAEMAGVSQRRDEIDAQIRAADVEVQRASQATAAAQAAWERDDRRVVEGRGAHASVRERDAELQTELRLLDEALNGAASVATCQADVDERTRQVRTELARVGFTDRAQALQAAIPDEERQALSEALEQRDQALARVEERLRELADVDEKTVVDLPTLQRELDAAVAEEAAALSARTVTDQNYKRALTAATHLRSVLAARQREARTTAPLIRIADIVAASTSVNSRSITLATFVLIERFRDVVAAANERLTAMSDGRYALEHVPDKSGQRRSGLGLTVHDVHSDRPRDPKTLSGGETFYCSLSLALGLADVVTAESGGVALETLFIDEGFGSLDAETLDQVLDVLVRLSQSGRTVGVVSHVSELKERIPERIQVRRLREGASTLRVLA